MNCPKCKNSVQPNARFCGTCGQVLDPGAAPGPGGGAVPPGMGGALPAGASAVWASASAAMPGLLERVKNIILTPKTEWAAIAPEATATAQLFTGYVMPLAGFAALMSFVRSSVIGVSLPFGATFRTPLLTGLVYALVSFGFALLFVFLIGTLINALAPSFSGTRDPRQALKVAAYAFTPAWLSTLLGLSPVLPSLLQLIAGLYGIYVLYLGLPILMRSPQEKAFGYTATVVICTILLGILLGILSAVVGHDRHAGGMFGAAVSDREQEREQGAAAVANMIGGALGTDDKGKAGLTAALANLAKAGEQSERQTAAGAGNSAGSGTTAAGSPADAAPTGDGAQNAVAATAGLVTALGGALGGNHRVAVVDFRTLTSLLPDSLPGMKRTDARGSSQGAVGVKTSSASGTYQGDGGGRIRIEILDLSGVSGLMDMAGTIIQNTESESDSGYERNRLIGGHSVHEKYDIPSKHGELSVMVAKRFQVDLTGDGVDMPALEQSLGQVDLAHLESMRDQGSQPQ